MDRLWTIADAADFLRLSPAAKSQQYDNWTADPQIGGRLSRFLEPGQVRVYVKDGLMKRYARARRGQDSAFRGVLAIPSDAEIVRSYIKPHGFRLADGRLVCWGRANTWKLVLMALYERAFADGGLAYGAVLTECASHFADDKPRAVVESAAKQLGIDHLAWTE